MVWQVFVNIFIFYFSVYIIGIYFVKLLEINNLMAAPVGLSVIVILLNILLVPFNLSIYYTRIILFILVIIIFAYLIIQNRIFYKNEHVILVLVPLVITLIPALVGGPQFFSFRGNWWDHFNYISSVLTLNHYEVDAIRSVDLSEKNIDPILFYGKAAVDTRPSVTLLGAIFNTFGKNIFFYSYSFLLSILALATLPLYLISRSISKNTTLNFIASISIIIGLWGQLLVDISVWSHILSLPILIAMLAVIVINIGEKTFSFNIKLFSLFFVSSVLIYPEASFIVTALLFFSYFIIYRERKLLKSFLIIPLLLLVVALIDYDGVLQFVVNQYRQTLEISKIPSKWFMYYGQFYSGFDFTSLFFNRIDLLNESANSQGVYEVIQNIFTKNKEFYLLCFNIIPVALGLYALVHWSIQFGIFASFIVSVCIIVLLFVSSYQMYKHVKNIKIFSFSFIFINMLFVLVTIFLLTGSTWQATKVMTYGMPLFLVLWLALLSEGVNRRKTLSPSNILLALYFISAFGFAGERMLFAFDKDGLGHPSPFPSILRHVDKTQFTYELPDKIGNCSGIVIDEEHFKRKHFLVNAARPYGKIWIKHGNNNEGEKFLLPDTGYNCFFSFKHMADSTIQSPVIKFTK